MSLKIAKCGGGWPAHTQTEMLEMEGTIPPKPAPDVGDLEATVEAMRYLHSSSGGVRRLRSLRSPFVEGSRKPGEEISASAVAAFSVHHRMHLCAVGKTEPLLYSRVVFRDFAEPFQILTVRKPGRR